MFFTDPGHTREVKMKSLGSFTIAPGFSYRIEDENGKECDVGTPGEIVILSPLRMVNYLTDKDNAPASWVRI